MTEGQRVGESKEREGKGREQVGEEEGEGGRARKE